MVPGIETCVDHAVTANADTVHLRGALQDFGYDGRCEQIARCLARDERDLAFARH